MRILVTGATSFIALKLINNLLDRNHEVISVIRENSGKAALLPTHASHSVVECSMGSYKKIGSLIEDDIDCAVLFAWNGTRGKDRDNHEMQHKNFLDSMDMIKVLSDIGCGKIVLAGSQAEYGHHKGIITEETECSPATEYGKEKLRLFKEAHEICAEKNITLIEPRYFSLYGEGDYEKTMVISMVKKMISGEDCELTEGIQMWDFLYIDDAVSALIQLIEKDCPSGAYNFGSGDTRQLKDFVIEMKEVLQSESRLLFGAVKYPETGMVSIAPDIKKLKWATGWQPEVSFKEGIKRIYISITEKDYE